MRLIIFLLVFTASCGAAVFTEKGTPKRELLSILETLYIPHRCDPYVIYEGVKSLLRKEGLELREICEKSLSYEQKTAILTALQDLGFVAEVAPKAGTYDDALVLGSYADTMRVRMEYLIEQYKSGVRFKRIFFLTGERRRDLNVESNRMIFFTNKVPQIASDVETEAGIMRVIWLQLDKPAELVAMTPITINASANLVQKNKKKRPHMSDAANELLKKGFNLEGRSYLAISTQPYVTYHTAVLTRILPAYYKGEVVGPTASTATLFSQYLDTLARSVHNEFWKLHPECPPIN